MKRCSEGIRDMVADAVREKYAGDVGSQNVFITEYSVGMSGPACCCLLSLGVKDTRCIRNAASTDGPAAAGEFGNIDETAEINA